MGARGNESREEERSNKQMMNMTGIRALLPEGKLPTFLGHFLAQTVICQLWNVRESLRNFPGGPP